MAQGLAPHVVARFWSYAPADMDPAQCWEWTGGRTGKNYGAFWVDGRTVGAHIVSYTLTYGPVPKGVVVRHRVCDNPPCINPYHLDVGTHADNAADRDERNRQCQGARHHLARLTTSDVENVLAQHAAGSTLEAIAQRYGVTKQAIWHIVRGKNWKSVTNGVDHRGPDLRAQRRADARRMRDEGLTLKVIGQRLGGVTPQAISYLLRTEVK